MPIAMRMTFLALLALSALSAVAGPVAAAEAVGFEQRVEATLKLALLTARHGGPEETAAALTLIQVVDQEVKVWEDKQVKAGLSDAQIGMALHTMKFFQLATMRRSLQDRLAPAEE